MATREDVVRVARSRLGTPFHHMGRLPGVGLDCAGLLISVARELELVAPTFDVPPYTMAPDGRMLEWCRKHMRETTRDSMQPGDVVLLITDREPQHLGILGNYLYGNGFSIIHAAAIADPPRVIETRLMFSRVMRFVAAFVMPEII